MLLTRAADVFLEQMKVERDWTPRSIASYRATYDRLAADYPNAHLADFEGRQGTDKLLACIGQHWGNRSGSTRAKVTSHIHSLFRWADEQGHIENDPARRIRCAPRRRADIYRPPQADVEACLAVTTLHERAPWVLMARRGFRASTICALRWADLDLQHGVARVQVKGGHRDWVPLGPLATQELQDVYRQLEPDPDDHVFTVEVEKEYGNTGRRRHRRDPKQPAGTKTLWVMVRRVCARAGVRLFGPHALRHSFATTFARQTRVLSGAGPDEESLQKLMGHTNRATTHRYVEELGKDDLTEALRRAAGVTIGAEAGNKTDPEGPSGGNPVKAPAGFEPAGEGSRDAVPGDTVSSGAPGDVSPQKPCHKVGGEGERA